MTAGQAVSPIAQPNSLAAMLDIGKYIVGSKSTESSSSAGNTAPLEQLLAGMNPQALEALVANLFSQGANQVPGLSAQFANATGSRVSNNSMLASSLAELNTSLAAAIAQAAVQQQGQAVNAAGQIASNTRTNSGTKTTGPGSFKSLVVPTVTGFALNRAGKAMDASKKASSVDTGPVPINTTFQNFPTGDISSGIPQVGDLGAFNEGFADAGAGTLIAGAEAFADAGGGIDDYGFGGFDIGSAAAIADTAASIPTDAFDFSDFADWGWFQDGGKVMPKPAYADGGVVRNRPNMGNPQPQQMTQAMAMPAVAGKRRTSSTDISDTVGDSSGTAAGVAGDPGVISQIAHISPLSILSFMAQLSLNAPITAIATNIAARESIQWALNQMFAPTAVAPTTAISAEEDAAVTVGFPPDSGVSDPNAPGNPGDPGFDPSDPNANSAPEGASGDAPAGADSGGGDGSGPSGPGDGAAPGDAYEDGGRVSSKSSLHKKVDGTKKKSAPASKGKATEGRFIRGGADDASGAVDITAHLNEYILPEDTVMALGGPGILDSIVAATHTPKRGGTNG